MDTPQPSGSDDDAIVPDGVLHEVERYLDAFDAWEGDRATEEDFIIIESLMRAVHAARSKGYGEELLMQVLRSLLHAPPQGDRAASG